MSVTRAEVHDLAREHRRLRLTRGARTDEDLVPRQRVPDYRTRLDARITRCPGCDGWCWDGACACGPSGVSVQVSGRIGPVVHQQDDPRRSLRRGSGHRELESHMTCPESYPPPGREAS